MQDKIPTEKVVEAGIMFAMTTVFLIPYLYWNIRAKLQEAYLPSYSEPWGARFYLTPLFIPSSRLGKVPSCYALTLLRYVPIEAIYVILC